MLSFLIMCPPPPCVGAQFTALAAAGSASPAALAAAGSALLAALATTIALAMSGQAPLALATQLRLKSPKFLKGGKAGD